MKLYQYSCREESGVDLRQANAVARYRPDVIIFEAPGNESGCESVFNRYQPRKKPAGEIKKTQAMLRRTGKSAPWVLSDIKTYDNVRKLWKEGCNVQLFNIDGPQELLRIGLERDPTQHPRPYRRGTHLMWWVRIYLRERIMADNLEKILPCYARQKEAVVLIFLQKFHWMNVKFLLSKPTKEELWGYYFGRFKNLDRRVLEEKIRKENPVLYSYWTKISDFA